MKYVSTRGHSSGQSFTDILLEGLAPDGGLMVPEAVRTTAFGFFSAAALFGGAVSPSVAGLVAHLAEEAEHPVGMPLWLDVDRRARGDG